MRKPVYKIATLDHVRSADRSSTHEPWHEWGDERANPFILKRHGWDSLRLVEPMGEGRYIVCNTWQNPLMAAPAFYYYAADFIIQSDPQPPKHGDDRQRILYDSANAAVVFALGPDVFGWEF